MTTVKIDNSNFQSDVLEAGEPSGSLTSGRQWCGPCKMIAPALEEIATELGGQRSSSPNSISTRDPELAARYGVRSIPTLIMFKGGEVADMKSRRRAQDRPFLLDRRRPLSRLYSGGVPFFGEDGAHQIE